MAARLPARVLELVFSYLDLVDLYNCALVCRYWHYCMEGEENSEVWRGLCIRTLPEEALRSDILCNVPTYKGKNFLRWSTREMLPTAHTILEALKNPNYANPLVQCWTSACNFNIFGSELGLDTEQKRYCVSIGAFPTWRKGYVVDTALGVVESEATSLLQQHVFLS